MGSKKKPTETLREAALRHAAGPTGRCWIRHGLPPELLSEVNALLRDTEVQATALARALQERGIKGATADKLRHHRNVHLLPGRPCP